MTDIAKILEDLPFTLSATERAEILDLASTASKCSGSGSSGLVAALSPETCAVLQLVILAGVSAIDAGAVSFKDPK